jgi:hypothetical protein
VALNRVPCPECGAGLKSPSGFKVGQTVCCPKCETYFTVEEPADEEAAGAKKSAAAGKAGAAGGKKPVKAAAVADDAEDAAPRKKKKKVAEDEEDEERSYKNSPARYAVLGVLVLVMIGLGVMLIIKKRNEAKDDDTADKPNPNVVIPDKLAPPPANPPGQAAPGVGGGGVRPKVDPKTNPGVVPPKSNPGGNFAIPLLDGGGSFLTPQQALAKVTEFKSKLAGTWRANLGGGRTSELVYRPDGTFTDTLTTGATPKVVNGTWTATSLTSGNKGLLVNRTAGGARTTVKAVFEGDELLHDTQERGLTGVFRK